MCSFALSQINEIETNDAGALTKSSKDVTVQLDVSIPGVRGYINIVSINPFSMS